MREIVRERLKKTTFVFEENTVTIRAARYRKRASESTTTTVFMPGFRVHGNSLAPRRLNRIFVEELDTPLVAISASSSRASALSPEQEAKAMTAYLQRIDPAAQEFYLAAHSQRTGQAMRVAQEMGQKAAGVILVSPIELSPHKGPRMAKEIVKAAFIHIPGDTAKGIIRGHGGLRKITQAGAIGATMIKEMIRETIVRGPGGHVRYMRQEIENAHAPVPQNIHAPVVVVLGQHDNVVPLRPAMANAQTVFPGAHIMVHDHFAHHGMIYQEPRTIIRRSKQLLGELRRSALQA